MEQSRSGRSRIESTLSTNDSCTVKNPLVYHVAPDKDLQEWAVIKEGAGKPRARGLSKEKAIRAVKKLAEKKARPALVLIHKTRYIIEKQLLVSC